MTDVLYKWLSGGQSCHGGSGQWRKNRWRTAKGPLVPCENGLHLCREQDLLEWVTDELWLAEADTDELLIEGGKVVVRRARVVEKLAWNVTSARLFAADCAEHMLPVFEAEFPGDKRPAEAIAAARAFARGQIGVVAAASAASAAWAAWAAGDASIGASVAAWAAGTASGAEAASATRIADAGAGAAGAAWAAERQWQTRLLLDYAHGRKT